MIDHLKRVPELKILIVTIFFALGIITMDYFPFSVSIFFYVLGIIYALLSKKFIVIVLVSVFILGGLDYFSYRLLDRNNIATFNTKNIKSVTGIVDTNIEKTNNSYKFNLIVKGVNNYNKCGKIIVYSKKKENLVKGDIIKLESFFFPIDHTSGKFDYGTYMERQDIYVATSITDKSKITILKKAKPSLLLKTKEFIVKTYDTHLNEPVAKLLMGMVLGKGTYLESDTYNNFINTGTLHLLAASGLNCFVLSATIFYIFFFIPLKYRYILTITIIWLYCALIGFPASIIRAAIMCTIFLYGKIIHRSTSYKHILFLSAFIFLLFSPKSLFDVGFQLSYLCLIGLLYVCPIINKPIYSSKFKFIKRFPKLELFVNNIYMPIILAVTTVISVNIFVLPISIYYFNYVSFVTVFTNVLVGFLASLIFVVSLLFLIFQYIPFISLGFIFSINKIGEIILSTVNYFGMLNNATMTLPTPKISVLFIYYIIVFLLFFYLNVKNLFEKK